MKQSLYTISLSIIIIVISTSQANNWEQLHPQGKFGYRPIISIVYGNDIFLALSSSGKAFKSHDGFKWDRLNGIHSGWTKCLITFGNGIFITANGSTLYSSIDGDKWILLPAPENIGFTNLYFCNNSFIALGGKDRILYYN